MFVTTQLHLGGGYAIHKITGYWKGRISAWFDSKGLLVNAVQFFNPEMGAFGRRQSVRWQSPMWKALQKIGTENRPE